MAEQLTLGQVTRDAAAGKLNYLIQSPSVVRYMEREKIPMKGIQANREAVVDGIWSFAQHFEGHEGENADQSDVEIYDPLEVPIGDYLDFFAAATHIYDLSKEETGGLHFWNVGKKGELEEIRENIGQDAERVAEALVYAVADVLADGDPALARLIGRLDVDIEAERSAENVDSEAEVNYAHHAGSLVNPQDGKVNLAGVQANTASIIMMSETDEAENRSEDRRVKDTKKIIKKIAPTLKEMHLLEQVEEWVGFSNED